MRRCDNRGYFAPEDTASAFSHPSFITAWAADTGILVPITLIPWRKPLGIIPCETTHLSSCILTHQAVGVGAMQIWTRLGTRLVRLSFQPQ